MALSNDSFQKTSDATISAKKNPPSICENILYYLQARQEHEVKIKPVFEKRKIKQVLKYR